MNVRKNPHFNFSLHDYYYYFSLFNLSYIVIHVGFVDQQRKEDVTSFKEIF